MPLPDSLAYATLAELRAGLAEGKFDSVELTEFFLERLERLGPRCNAVVTVVREPALREAAVLDAERRGGKLRGPLHGIPYGAKDLLDTAGIPTTWGAEPFRKRVPTTDAAAIVRLRNAGAILVAKLAMVEIAGGLGYEQANASFTGPGLNPWNVAHWSGGSSSGCGSAVAAGLVPFAIGTETWGSIVTPSAFCGVVGLRPTFGRISTRGAMALAWSFDKLGPMAHSADDCGTILAAVAGPEPDDDATHLPAPPFVWPAAQGAEAEPAPPQHPKPFGGRRPRVGILRDPQERCMPEVGANFDRTLTLLEPGVEFVDVRLPDFPYSTVASTIIACEAAAAFGELIATGEIHEMTAPEDRIGLHAAMFVPAVDYLRAQRIRRRIAGEFRSLPAGVDVLVAPGMPAVAGRLETPFSEHFSRWRPGRIGALGNLLGAPAICLPNGFGPDGLPTAIQFVGLPYREGDVLELALRTEAKLGPRRRTPPPLPGGKSSDKEPRP